MDSEPRWRIWALLRAKNNIFCCIRWEKEGRSRSKNVCTYRSRRHMWAKEMRISSLFSSHLHLNFSELKSQSIFLELPPIPVYWGGESGVEKAGSGGGGCNP